MSRDVEDTDQPRSQANVEKNVSTYSPRPRTAETQSVCNRRTAAKAVGDRLAPGQWRVPAATCPAVLHQTRTSHAECTADHCTAPKPEHTLAASGASGSALRCCAAILASRSVGSAMIGAAAEALAGSFCGCDITDTGLLSDAGPLAASPNPSASKQACLRVSRRLGSRKVRPSGSNIEATSVHPRQTKSPAPLMVASVAGGPEATVWARAVGVGCLFSVR